MDDSDIKVEEREDVQVEEKDWMKTKVKDDKVNDKDGEDKEGILIKQEHVVAEDATAVFLKNAKKSTNTLNGRLRHVERQSASLSYKVTYAFIDPCMATGPYINGIVSQSFSQRLNNYQLFLSLSYHSIKKPLLLGPISLFARVTVHDWYVVTSTVCHDLVTGGHVATVHMKSKDAVMFSPLTCLLQGASEGEAAEGKGEPGHAGSGSSQQKKLQCGRGWRTGKGQDPKGKEFSIPL